jgi:coenzyme F420 hydrogenase subunit alpha
MEFMLEVIRNMQSREFVEVAGKQIPIPKKLGYHNLGVMATSPMYGSSSLDEKPMWDIDRWKETRPWEWYMGEVTIDLEDPSYPFGGTTKAGTKANPRMEACNGVPTYDGQPVEVGPRARLATYKNFDEKGTFAQNIARQMEYPDCCYTILKCLDKLNTSGKVLADYIPQGDGSMGWAANEAPRGTDVHLTRVKDGKVLWYEMLVPTTWNLPTCSRALTGAPWQISEMVVRAYDPCVSCATHVIVIDEENKTVAQKILQW